MSSLYRQSKCRCTTPASEKRMSAGSRPVSSPSMVKVGFEHTARLINELITCSDKCETNVTILFLGLYLISPSEFERFSLSARWVVEPRCLVEVPSQTIPTSHTSQSHRDQPDGASTEHKYDYFLLAYLTGAQAAFLLNSSVILRICQIFLFVFCFFTV